MMTRLFFALLLLVLTGVSERAFGQSPGCMSIASVANATNPAFSVNPNGVLVIPVVFHVIYNVNDATVGQGSNISDAQVQSALQMMNDAYRNTSGLGVDMEIEFCLAKVKPDGSFTNGIDRINGQSYPSYPIILEGITSSLTALDIAFYNMYSWDPSKYLNIWIAQDIRIKFANGNYNDPVSLKLFGSSIIPEVHTAYLYSSRDGIWIRNDEVGNIGTAYNTASGWLVHEIGHWLNLKHLVEGTPCFEVDGFADTPAYSAGSLSAAIQGGLTCGQSFTDPACNITFVPDNYMIGYVPQEFDACFARFTPEQKQYARLSVANLRPDVYFIKGDLANSICGCQDVGNITTPYSFTGTFNIGYNQTNSLFTPFDINYTTLQNWNPPSHIANYISVAAPGVIGLNNENVGSGGVGDANNASFFDIISTSLIQTYIMEGDRLELGAQTQLLIGDPNYGRTGNFEIGCSGLLDLAAGSSTSLFNNSTIIVKATGSLIIRAGATVTLNNNSKIIVENGGYICIENGAIINLPGQQNVIAISPNSLQGVNPLFQLMPNCSFSGPINGLGAITCYGGDYSISSGIVINNGGTTIWNSSERVKGQIFITNNSTLIIRGNSTVIQFADSREVGETTGIIVDRGSRLIIEDGAVLQGDVICNGMWDGIQVWGTRSAPQLPFSSGNQGQIIMRTGATIRDAYEGIKVFRADVNGNVDWNFTGGIVSASDANFINCGRGVNFLSYRNGVLSNASYFRNCLFETNAQLNKPGESPVAGVSMYDVKGIRFNGCVFRNTATSVYSAPQRGVGIVSADASYYVDDNCSSLINPCPQNSVTHTRFENLFYGIYAADAIPFNPISIQNAEFIGNTRGVLLRGVDYATIVGNTFDVGRVEVLNNVTYDPYGLYLEFCSGYKVESNVFTTTVTNNSGTVGMAVYFSGPQTNRIYNNTFDNLYVGTLVMENNGDNISQSGLEIKCNDYGLQNVNVYDVALTDNGTIRPSQGNNFSQTGPAGNRFSHSCTGTAYDNDFSAPTSPFNILYIHNPDFITTPLCYSNSTISNQVAVSFPFNKPTSCPPPFENCDAPCLKQRMIASSSAKSGLQQQIDGGQTAQLVQLVNTGSSGQIQTGLLQYSPYLSDQVLLAVVYRSQPLPSGIIRNILIANSPLSDSVVVAVQALSLPTGIRNQINAAQTGVSARDIVLANINGYQADFDLAQSELIRFYLQDTTSGAAMDSVLTLLKMGSGAGTFDQQISFLVFQGQYAAALHILDSLDATGYNNNFCKLQRYLIVLKLDVNDCFKLKQDGALANQVEAVAQDCCDKSGCANAQALLTLVLSQRFDERIVFPTANNTRTSAEPNVNVYFLNVYPNPADQFIQIILPDETVGNVALTVSDVTGREVYTYQHSVGNTNVIGLDVGHLAEGLYTITMVTNDGKRYVERLVIKH